MYSSDRNALSPGLLQRSRAVISADERATAATVRRFWSHLHDQGRRQVRRRPQQSRRAESGQRVGLAGLLRRLVLLNRGAGEQLDLPAFGEGVALVLGFEIAAHADTEAQLVRRA